LAVADIDKQIMHIGTTKLNRTFFINNHALPCTRLCKDFGISLQLIITLVMSRTNK